MHPVTMVRPCRSKNVWFLVLRKENFKSHLDQTEICSPPWALLVLRFWRSGRLRWFVGIMFAWQIGGLHADLARCHVVIFWLRHSLKIFIEPAHDVLQALHAVPGLSGARKLMRFSGEAHHDDRTLQELKRAEHFFTARARRRAEVSFTQHQHQRRVNFLNVSDGRPGPVILRVLEGGRLETRWLEQ